MTALTLYSAWYCPFAQRTWFALEHLGLPFEYVEIDPYDKTPGWLAISRGLGQVPVIEMGNGPLPARIPDSVRTMEYLDDLGDGKLFCASAPARAEERFWLDQIGREIIPYFYRFLKAPTGTAEGAEARSALEAGIVRFFDAAPDARWISGGPHPGVLDFALAPFAYRIALLLPVYKGYALPSEGTAWRRFHAWLDRVTALPAYRATMPNSDTYQDRLIGFYDTYAKGGGQSDVTKVA